MADSFGFNLHSKAQVVGVGFFFLRGLAPPSASTLASKLDKEKKIEAYTAITPKLKNTQEKRGESDFTANFKNALDTSPGGDGIGKKEIKTNMKERQKRGLLTAFADDYRQGNIFQQQKKLKFRIFSLKFV